MTNLSQMKNIWQLNFKFTERLFYLELHETN